MPSGPYLEKEVTELVTFGAQTTVSSGTFSLTSDIFVTPITKFVMPKGARVKIWSRLLSGPPATVNYQFANDGSTFRTVVSDDLASAGDFVTEKRRPHIFRSYAGTEAIQLTYTGASSGLATTVAFDAEISRDTPY